MKKLAVCVCLAAGLIVSAAAQKPAPVKPPKSEPPPRAGVPAMPEPPMPVSPRGVSERAIAVDPNVNIQLPCIAEARVSVNGWQRDEVRIFIRNGSNVGFKVHEKSSRTGKPVWIVVRKTAGGPVPSSECISGERIDIEVPAGAVLKISGRETETSIDTVKKVDINNVGGNVALRNVTGGISARTFEGDVTVENSAGQIDLTTSTGNIIAAEVGPGQVGDVFKARTSNGAITLQKVDHRQIEASSVSGEVVFNGKFLPGGIYTFKTEEGNMRLVIPPDSSCRVRAWYGFGTISSQLPMKPVSREASAEVGKSLVGLIGEGDATVNLTTNRGRISIIKQADEP